MEPVSTIATVLSSIKTAMDIARSLKTSDQALEKAESKLALVEMMSTLADVKTSVIELQDSIRAKDDEIERLIKAFQLKDNLIRYQDAYYEMDSNGKPSGSGYCSGCFELKGLAVHLCYNSHMDCICPNCKSSYHPSRAGPIRTPN